MNASHVLMSTLLEGLNRRLGSTVVAGVLSRGERAHPELHAVLGPERLLAHVERVLTSVEQVALEALHVEDLWLVAGALEGDRASVETLKRLVDREVRAAVRRQPNAAQLADEVCHLLLMRLVVAEHDRRPKLLEYSARGPLGAWLRASALGLALNTLRAAGPPALDDAFEEQPVELRQDPEAEYLRSLCRTEFHAAFKQALATLELKERRVIRLRFLDGLTLDELAAYFRVHRATVVRWLAELTERLFEETKRRLRVQLTLEQPEVDSLLRAARSIDFSLSRLLREVSELGDAAQSAS